MTNESSWCRRKKFERQLSRLGCGVERGCGQKKKTDQSGGGGSSRDDHQRGKKGKKKRRYHSSGNVQKSAFEERVALSKQNKELGKKGRVAALTTQKRPFVECLTQQSGSRKKDRPQRRREVGTLA